MIRLDRRAQRALSLVTAVVLLGAASPRPFDPEPYSHAQRLVDVGGRRLNISCTGHGSPAVVLDSDGHEGTVQWRYVQPFVAKQTRVCSYDAAGFGFSDPGPPPRDANAFVRDLHTLLTRAGVAPPWVLVGYQPSGAYDRLFADRYLTDVAGMVLVDPDETDRTARLTAVAPALAPLFAGVLPFDRQCYAAAVKGTMHPGTTAFANCVSPDPSLPRALAVLNEKQWARPGTWQDYLSVDECSNAIDSREIAREQRSYGALPLIVLTSDTAALQLPIPPAQVQALTAARERWHDQIAALSSLGTDFVIAGSSDSIAIDAPFSVVSAIDEVVAQARARKSGASGGGMR